MLSKSFFTCSPSFTTDPTCFLSLRRKAALPRFPRTKKASFELDLGPLRRASFYPRRFLVRGARVGHHGRARVGREEGHEGTEVEDAKEITFS